jgi:hypothetical protein
MVSAGFPATSYNQKWRKFMQIINDGISISIEANGKYVIGRKGKLITPAIPLEKPFCVTEDIFKKVFEILGRTETLKAKLLKDWKDLCGGEFEDYLIGLLLLKEENKGFTMVEPELAPFGRKNGFGEQLYAGVKY